MYICINPVPEPDQEAHYEERIGLQQKNEKRKLVTKATEMPVHVPERSDLSNHKTDRPATKCFRV